MANRKIFINYRREDSRGEAGRLFDRLRHRFPGQVFMDVSSIEPGLDFVEAIEQEVGSCDACIVVIGKRWLVDDTGRRRLDDPQDYVRLEIATALRRNIRVFPVLVSGAIMPSPEDLPEDVRPLTRRNALQIFDQDWDHDVERLVAAIERALGISDGGGGRSKQGRRSGRVWLGIAGALALVALVSLAVVHRMEFLPRQSPAVLPAPEHNQSPVPSPAPAPKVSPAPTPPVVPPRKPSAQIRDFSAPATVVAGTSARLCYQVLNARSARIDPEVGELDPKALDNDCRSVLPKQTATYTLTVTGLNGEKMRRAVTVTVQAPPNQSGFAVTSVSQKLVPESYSGKCPVTVIISATLTVRGSGTVTYRWIRSSGEGTRPEISSPQSVSFAATGSQIVSDTWTLSAGSPSGLAWAAVDLITPKDHPTNYPKAVLKLSCEPPQVPGSIAPPTAQLPPRPGPSVLLAIGTTVPLRGTTISQEHDLAGPVLKESLIAFRVMNDTGEVLCQGNLQNRVVRSSETEQLHFYYIIRDTSGGGRIRSLETSAFVGPVSVGYRLNGLGVIGPSSASRIGPIGQLVRFDFEGPGIPCSDQSSGGLSRGLFIKTNATTFGLGGLGQTKLFLATGESVTLSTFMP